jgi:oxygen-independent coproporphyrinogen-3 oxidase
LPIGKEKYALYSIGKNMLVEAGYEDVGMDHFAFKTDSLLKSKLEGLLHRNFMGYTTNNTEILIGLGVSAISDVFFGYRQNLKTVDKTTWTSDYVFSESEIQLLQQLEKDKLIVLKENNLELTQLGWSFLRNICTVFDKKLNASKLTNQGTPKFSQAI